MNQPTQPTQPLFYSTSRKNIPLLPGHLSRPTNPYFLCERLFDNLCNANTIITLLGDNSAQSMYNKVLPDHRGYIPMFVGRYLTDSYGAFTYETQLGSLDPFLNQEIQRRLCVWNLRQEVRVNVAQFCTSDNYLGDERMLGEEWNDHLLQTVRCLAQKHGVVEVLGVQSIPPAIDVVGMTPSRNGLSITELQRFQKRNNITGLEALKKICVGTGVHTITCMDVFATEGAQETASLQDIVRVCCDELQVKSLSIYEYRGQERLYRQMVGLTPAYPHYKFTDGHWNGRHLYNMRV